MKIQTALTKKQFMRFRTDFFAGKGFWVRSVDAATRRFPAFRCGQKEPTALSGGRLPAGHRTVSQWLVHGAAPTSVAAVSPPAGARTALLPTTPVTANEHFSAVSPAPVCTDEYGIAIRTSYDEDNHYLYAHYCYCYGSGVNERRILLKYLPDYIKQ